MQRFLRKHSHSENVALFRSLRQRLNKERETTELPDHIMHVLAVISAMPTDEAARAAAWAVRSLVDAASASTE